MHTHTHTLKTAMMIKKKKKDAQQYNLSFWQAKKLCLMCLKYQISMKSLVKK